ncbi:helix-turn-helix domain-containing protein [Streptomyces olivaceoviridis]|uniref:helix-turn-helix domain-containing protein n=1 Tax=Streptomyces olivaceoviridis TaxID=1921 RepID=UPI0007183986|nr:Transcriptional regulator [Streptomyces hygroscopicus subsp. limoneus]
MLSVLGIAEPDEEVYRCFVDHGQATVEEVCASLGVPEQHVVRCVARLRDLGLLYVTGLSRYQATDPQTAMLPLLARRQWETEMALASARAEIDRIAERYREGRLRSDPRNLVEVLSDRGLILERVAELSNSATSHMWALDRPPYVGRPDGRLHSNEDEFGLTKGWLERGIDVRSIYCPQSMERPGRFAMLLRLAELGERARMLPSLPFKLHIIDRRVALVPLSGPVYDDLVVIHPSAMLDALMELYEAYWNRAEPITGPAPAGDDGLDEDDVLLLRMLKAGLKDQAIARQLGCSTRTATRRVAAVLARLGADTRFQAGATAAARGLI